MKCPYCGAIDSRVIDSRPTEDGEKIRRRRECLSCKKRFTTYEIVETVPLMVVKKDHSREVFDRQKLLNGMLRACEKRPVSYQQLDDAVNRIEQTLLNSYDREVSSIHIGDLAMEQLKQIDDAADGQPHAYGQSQQDTGKAYQPDYVMDGPGSIGRQAVNMEQLIKNDAVHFFYGNIRVAKRNGGQYGKYQSCQ